MTQQYTTKVSVIIPVYNVEPYLRECLDSVVNQTLRDIEIICVDDGSTDGSPAILEEYRNKDSRIKVITQENRGQSVARNRGMDAACGEYIYFIDSDDYVDTVLLEKTTALADEMDLDVLVFGLESFVESGEKSGELQFSVRSAQNSPGVFSGVGYMKWAKDNDAYPPIVVAQLWRAGFFADNALRFDEGIIYEDELFSFKAFMAAKRVFQITDCYYHYRRWKDSTTLKPASHKNVESYFACAMGVLKYAFRESNTPEEDHEIWRAYVHESMLASDFYYFLSATEKAKVTFESKMENELFRRMIITATVSDKDYRLLRAITWLPRNVGIGFHCLKEYGLRDTLRLTREYFARLK
ncbi:MAG: glycosyltransferase [Lachnospiraceae bacterium]|nr:glycosyltransferase [Lachnospiraceae bacterium]